MFCTDASGDSRSTTPCLDVVARDAHYAARDMYALRLRTRPLDRVSEGGVLVWGRRPELTAEIAQLDAWLFESFAWLSCRLGPTPEACQPIREDLPDDAPISGVVPRTGKAIAYG